MSKKQQEHLKSPRSKAKDMETKISEEINTSLVSAKNIRTYIGGFLLLLGSFLLVAITSYFFTWKQDQGNLITAQSIFDFLFFDDSVVNNWSGRFGAVFSHLLVYDGVGVSAIVFSIWLALTGMKLMYPKRYFGLKKWRKLMAFSILFISPLLAFIFPNAAFPLGGALGNQLIEWTNGFAGTAGNVLMLVAVFCFFIFIIFQFDIKPLLEKAKSFVPNTHADFEDKQIGNETFKGYRHFTPQEEKDRAKSVNKQEEKEIDKENIEAEKNIGNRLKPSLSDDLEVTNQENLKENNKQSKKAGSIHLELPQDNQEETLLLDLDMAEVEKELEEENEDFEITRVTDEEQIPKNGSHISIESQEPYDPSLDLPNFKFPTLDLLNEMDSSNHISFNKEELEKNKNQIVHTLRSFGIEIQKIKATVGPTVTLYEIIPAEGVRISKIKNLEDDIALTLAALGIRIIAPIPGRGTIGIEVPNTEKQIVGMRTLLSSEKFINNTMSLPIALGKKIDNENYIVDLATMPHLLMAGATGQGKSVGINAILVSLLYKKHPSQLKFVMVDPKKVELSIYRVIEKHYLAMLPNEEEPIITDVKKVIHTVNALCIEMDNRYELLKDAGARNIKEYNDKFIKRRLNPLQGHKYLPFIVLVIDEFADLIMTAGKEVEMPIARLAQLARAVGIHIIIATQRPSVNVITGIIKANFPARMAFKVSAKVDSRTILDAGGAEQLIGKGDMLVSHGSELIRLQCAFVDTPEVEKIVNFIGEQRGYPSAFELPEYEDEEGVTEKEAVDLSKKDKNFEECARLVVSSQSGSTSMLQRRFNLGYNRAGRIMDQLEAAGIVGPQVGSKPRELLVSTEYELENILKELA